MPWDSSGSGQVEQDGQQIALGEETEVDPSRPLVARQIARMHIEPAVHPVRDALRIDVEFIDRVDAELLRLEAMDLVEPGAIHPVMAAHIDAQTADAQIEIFQAARVSLPLQLSSWRALSSMP